MSKKYCADFETCTWLEDETYVWAYSICEISDDLTFNYGTNIDDFMKFCENSKNATFYFH
jgi:hypothetical protein